MSRASGISHRNRTLTALASLTFDIYFIFIFENVHCTSDIRQALRQVLVCGEQDVAVAHAKRMAVFHLRTALPTLGMPEDGKRQDYHGLEGMEENGDL